jgi:hypothetical protein
MAQIDWGAYAEEAEKQGGFAPLAIGTYNNKVDSADVKPAKNDHYAILTRLVVTDGPLANKSILNNMTPWQNDGSENGFFTQALSALGYGQETNPGFWQQLQTMGDEHQAMLWIAQTILGGEATIEVTHRPYNNEMKDNVKKMVPKGSMVASGPAAGAGVPGQAPVLPGVPPPPVAASAALPPVAQPAATPVVSVAPVAAAPVVEAPVAAEPAVAAAVAAPAAQPVPVAAAVPAQAAQPVAQPAAAVAVPAAVPEVTAPVPAVMPAAPILPDDAPF